MDLQIVQTMVAEAQSLAGTDLIAIGTLAILEGILSVDNSLVLAILVRTLPKNQQRKALTYGIAGAFLFRLIALIFAAYLIKFLIFKIIGGLYLVYLAMKHMFFFFQENAHQTRPKVAKSFWGTVLVVELTDIAFSIDSITTAVAMSNKLLVVWLGGIMGIIFLRFAASIFIRLLEKLPRLEDLAYQLIFFIGTKLLLEGFHIEITHETFWLMMGIIVVLGSALVWRDYYQRKTQSRFENRILTQLKEGEMSVAEVLGMEYVPREVIAYLSEQGLIEIRPGSLADPGE
ncbi:MAG TPA: TerC family protein [Deltaproteobacteria bacterium]|nr:TerC family protein [Deltaproteobacteria bacterium]